MNEITTQALEELMPLYETGDDPFELKIVRKIPQGYHNIRRSQL